MQLLQVHVFPLERALKFSSIENKNLIIHVGEVHSHNYLTSAKEAVKDRTVNCFCQKYLPFFSSIRDSGGLCLSFFVTEGEFCTVLTLPS